MGGQSGRTGEVGVLLEERIGGRGRSGKEEDVEDSRFGDPVGLYSTRLWPGDVHPGFGGGKVEDSNRGGRRMGVKEGDRSVESHGGGRFVLEDVDVEQSVRLGKVRTTVKEYAKKR